MFDARGRDQGQRDGAADAALGLPARPRPDLVLAVLSTGYRDSYLVAYRSAWRARQAHEDRIRAQGQLKKARPSDVPKARQSAKAKRFEAAFDQGWRTGFAGQDLPKARRTVDPEERDAQERGYRIGARDRDYARAKALRSEMTKDHDRGR